MKEGEAANGVSEKTSLTDEAPVVDRELINKLTSENEELKVSLLTVNYVYFLC